MTNKTLEERFFEKVHINTESGCWEWTAYRCKQGYGIFRKTKGKHCKAHRFSFEWFRQPIEKGMSVCHTCDNTSCCNPYHLFQGTHADNMHDMISKGRANFLKGSQIGHAKLDEKAVVLIRKFIERHGNGSGLFLGRWFSVHHGQISKIKNGKTWSHVS